MNIYRKSSKFYTKKDHINPNPKKSQQTVINLKNKDQIYRLILKVLTQSPVTMKELSIKEF